ncbi:MerR family transcriptional regulator [Pediococcus pentosaceus]|uniref:MerR family transcriptional regulator n=1 Tax=Pediococcus pentosaceus TaxID=1255 RepID=UPI00223B73C5|nr:MerR family transcriptional regulator [Pediococcus pentosaceus]
MKISDVSKKFNISIQTLRYYEREGLIPAIHRDSNGVRDYQKDELYWIHYVQVLRNSGVTVASIKKYVGLVQKGSETREQRKQILFEQRQALLKKRTQIDDALKHMDIKLESYDTYVIELENNTKKQNSN